MDNTNINSAPVLDSLRPIGFRVLINTYLKPTETASGLSLPETEHNGMPAMGQITMKGKKTLWQRIILFLGFKPKYKVGQWVYFRKFSVDELQVETPEGKLNLYVLEENEIIGLVNA